MNPSQPNDLRQEIAAILVKWSMPTRQVAINEIEQLFTDRLKLVKDSLPLFKSEDDFKLSDWETNRNVGFNEAIEEVNAIISKVMGDV